ncbi:MAG: SDR family NAD(P)-dependent oxidoreductase [Rikenellaceae bacterium]|nr:SDR family NAD(P)-dependent oxidoreductase [Rikenellaceae bacterium]MBO5759348.1 SDR family NAD(P)-dependent oxidoreductase [Rikenellaceae bacterium]
MSKILGKCVCITGGASGVGKIMGRIALSRGARMLVIWDINQANIDSTIAELSTMGAVKGYRVNVADFEAVKAAYEQVKTECSDVDILINCAGIVRGNNTFENQTVEDIDLTMAVNTKAPMYTSLCMLPDMKARNSGHICNIASAGGMLSNPKMSVYAASKWAVIGWSDSVRIELAQERSKVRITTIAPYFINTGMFDGVRSPIFPILDPDRTSRKIIRAIERNRDFRGIPFGFHFIRLMQGLFPTVVFDWLFGKVLGIYSAMDNFKGRKE